MDQASDSGNRVPDDGSNPALNLERGNRDDRDVRDHLERLAIDDDAGTAEILVDDGSPRDEEES